MAFLVQMRQSKKCRIVTNGKIISLHLQFGVGLSVSIPAPCKTAATFIDSIHPNNQPGKNKESRNEIQLPTNLTVLSWPTYTKSKAKRSRLESQP